MASKELREHLVLESDDADDCPPPHPPYPLQQYPPRTSPQEGSFNMASKESYEQPPAYAAAGYPPPNPPYPPQQYPPGTSPQGYNQPGAPQNVNYSQSNTVVVAQPMVSLIQTFHDSPVRITCPHCRADITTATTSEAGTFTWVVCLVLCLVGCSLGCCLIPFCVDGCKDTKHACPNCQQHLGTYRKL